MSDHNSKILLDIRTFVLYNIYMVVCNKDNGYQIQILTNIIYRR